MSGSAWHKGGGSKRAARAASRESAPQGLDVGDVAEEPSAPVSDGSAVSPASDEAPGGWGEILARHGVGQDPDVTLDDDESEEYGDGTGPGAERAEQQDAILPGADDEQQTDTGESEEDDEETQSDDTQGTHDYEPVDGGTVAEPVDEQQTEYDGSEECGEDEETQPDDTHGTHDDEPVDGGTVAEEVDEEDLSEEEADEPVDGGTAAGGEQLQGDEQRAPGTDDDEPVDGGTAAGGEGEETQVDGEGAPVETEASEDGAAEDDIKTRPARVDVQQMLFDPSELYGNNSRKDPHRPRYKVSPRSIRTVGILIPAAAAAAVLSNLLPPGTLPAPLDGTISIEPYGSVAGTAAALAAWHSAGRGEAIATWVTLGAAAALWVAIAPTALAFALPAAALLRSREAREWLI